MKKTLLALLGIIGILVVFPLAIASIVLGLVLSPIALVVVAVSPVKWDETMAVRYFIAYTFILLMFGIVETAF